MRSRRLDANKLYKNRDKFEADLEKALKASDLKVPTPIWKAIVGALSERDPNADICTDKRGNPEPDPELRDTESVPLPPDIVLPLPIGYEDKADNADLIKLTRTTATLTSLKKLTLIGLTHGSIIPRPRLATRSRSTATSTSTKRRARLTDIERDIKKLEGEILDMLKEVA